MRNKHIENRAVSVFAGIILGLLTCSCEKELDFKYKDIEPILVIEGALTQNRGEVSLTMTTPMAEPMNRVHLTDAEVVLSDLTSGETFLMHPDNDGVYVSDTGGITGHEYKLTVKREGKEYVALSTMGQPTEITGMEFDWIKMPYDYVAVLQVSFTDDPSSFNDCYWLRIYRNGEAYKWVAINDLLSDNGIIHEVMMTTRKDLDEEDEKDKIEPGDEIKATVVPINRAMHDYLEALSVGNSNGPRMFTGDFCLGYFLAGPITTQTVIF